ncbi:DUF5626 family protein [Enterococcus sp. LJL90]
MKKLFLILLVVFCFILCVPVYAQAESNQELVYDLEGANQIEQLTVVEEDGEEMILTIEKLPSVARASLSSGTYKISKTSKGSWTVSYNVTVNSKNQFTGTSNLNLKALKGSIVSNSLTHTSTQAICSFKQKDGLITTNASVTTTISNGQLIVK